MKLIETTQFKTGKEVESYLDEYARRRRFEVEMLTVDEERRQHLGDRRWRRGGHTYLVEYKSGIQTHFTRNVFLETVSVDMDGTPGWVYTSQADWIIYACVLDHKLLWFKPGKLRAEIERLKKRYRTAATSRGQNATYRTHGVLVPLSVAEKELAAHVTELVAS